MKDILSHYSIHSNTMALLPSNHKDYDTIVKEPDRDIYVRQKPLELIKQACLERFATYEGVREAVQHNTGLKRKVPIPINPHLNLYFFPTHATNHFDCCWISYYHVLRIEKHLTNHTFSTILFKSGDRLNLDVSPYVLKKQMERTLMCMDGHSIPLSFTNELYV
ncbi:competence protein ComK [Oceanobacillus sp. FSL K6-0118]|uniref:competence protein ComK n=1 Tax=Oceanobacillus sp. FSL K6-0118 TaxID=2921418 RepID=UPI0030F51801